MQDRKTRLIMAGVCLSIVIGTLAFFYIQVEIAKKSAIRILTPYIEGDAQIEKVINNPNLSSEAIPKNKVETLKTQYHIIKSKKKHHLEITKLMNAYYFGSTLSLAILTIVLAVLLIRVADKGLQAKSILFRTVFYTILSLTTFFGVLIQVLDHKENIAINKATFIAYSSTQLKIYNYLITEGRNDLGADTVGNQTVDDFITSINQEINVINNITFGIEHERIKSADDILKDD